ncbi:MAG TPA: hypothetical protein VJ994_00775 [Paracoccaceae bacterium]|nr:hypothetical protein [Paracoccaceae bacterium]
MDILLGVIGLVVGVVAGRMTAPKPAAGAEDRTAELERRLEEARRAKAAAETALREAESAPAADHATEAAPADAGGDAELLAAENAALRKALSAAEARAARAEMG